MENTPRHWYKKLLMNDRLTAHHTYKIFEINVNLNDMKILLNITKFLKLYLNRLISLKLEWIKAIR